MRSGRKVFLVPVLKCGGSLESRLVVDCPSSLSVSFPGKDGRCMRYLLLSKRCLGFRILEPSFVLGME